MNTTTDPSSMNDSPSIGRPPLKKRPTSFNEPNIHAVSSSSNEPGKDVSEARARRLEQNRRAAVESRRRKKVMLEELRRSVTFYTKANSNLKMQNQDLERKICFAKQRIAHSHVSDDAVALDSKSENSGEPEWNGLRPSKHDAESVCNFDERNVTKDEYQGMRFSPETADEAMKALSQLRSSSEVHTVQSSFDLFKGCEIHNNEATDAYISALSEFAMQQAQAANAAAAAAKAALHVVSWHKRRKSSGGVAMSNEIPSIDLHSDE